MFKEEQHEINRLMTEKRFTQTAKTKNYYPRPTPVDLQFEEDGMWNSAQYDGMWNSAQYDGSSIVEWNIDGFVGQLKGWWDFHLSDSTRTQILNAQVAIGLHSVQDLATGVIKSENVYQEDAVNSLIYTITLHFVGTTELQHDRQDCNADFWKEKFLSGLPILFAEKGKKFGGRRTKTYEKYESKSKPKKPYRTFKKKKYAGETSKKASKGKKGVVPTCYKCGKVGHYKSEYKMKDKINNLSISEELKQQLCQIMLNSSDSEQDSDNELAHLENEELFESNTETSSDSENECACQVNDLKICVLTKEESLIIDLIDKIEDPDKKKEVQESYISLATAGPSNPQPIVTNVRQLVENYSFKTIVNKMNDKIHKKEPTLNDLQCEVHDVKEELRELKNRVRILELYYPFSEKDT
ncbi:unnamed protein product [Prunus armeniaca]